MSSNQLSLSFIGYVKKKKFVIVSQFCSKEIMLMFTQEIKRDITLINFKNWKNLLLLYFIN